jgi:hypothetical protein
MARLFKPMIAKGPRNNRHRERSKKWYVAYRDADGIERTTAGYADKAATLHSRLNLNTASPIKQRACLTISTNNTSAPSTIMYKTGKRHL